MIIPSVSHPPSKQLSFNRRSFIRIGVASALSTHLSGRFLQGATDGGSPESRWAEIERAYLRDADISATRELEAALEDIYPSRP